jgi:LAO/AO transport system kinase
MERQGPRALVENKQLLTPASTAFRVGITGPPGAGKSTLIGALLGELRKQKQKVAVLAVDPSSPITHGAVLGDRIRYSDHTLDPNVFIRSLGTRGSLGGLSSATYLMLRALDVCGFDWVIVETVGVGQVEVEIMNVADCVALVLVPESGDSIQAMKAGLLEIADLVVVNKSDRPGADSFRHEIESAIQMSSQNPPKVAEVFSTTAINSQGVSELYTRLQKICMNTGWAKNRLKPAGLRAEARALLRAQIEAKVEKRLITIQSVGDLTRTLELTDESF